MVTTFDGAQVTLFVDGVQRAQRPSTVAIAHPSVPLLIGAGNGDPASNTFRGSIDEVAIYPTALSPEQVQSHFRVATGGP